MFVGKSDYRRVRCNDVASQWKNTDTFVLLKTGLSTTLRCRIIWYFVSQNDKLDVSELQGPTLSSGLHPSAEGLRA